MTTPERLPRVPPEDERTPKDWATLGPWTDEARTRLLKMGLMTLGMHDDPTPALLACLEHPHPIVQLCGLGLVLEAKVEADKQEGPTKREPLPRDEPGYHLIEVGEAFLEAVRNGTDPDEALETMRRAVRS